MEQLRLKVLFNDLCAALNEVYDTQEARSVVLYWLEERLHVQKSEILADRVVAVSKQIRLQIDCDLERLKNHEPIQYIVQKAYFHGLPFFVNSSVLIPRPETEELVHMLLQNHPSEKQSLKILDIGTGSGSIAISLKIKRPNWQVSAWDVSEDALEVAKRNANQHGASIEFVKQDMTKWQNTLKEEVDIIVSNPPYVMHKEAMQIEKRVKNHEPKIALFAPQNDAIYFYRHIIRIAKNLLSENGKVYLEINALLSELMLNWLEKESWAKWTCKKDMFGKDRYIIGEK